MVIAASTMPIVSRFASRCATAITRSSSKACTRIDSSPLANESITRLARRGSWAANSLASSALATIEPGETPNPAPRIAATLSRIASAGSKSGSRWATVWSRFNSALPTIDISAGGRSPCVPESRASSTSTEPACSCEPSATVPETRWATSSRKAAASKSSSGWPMPARIEATCSPSPSPIPSSSFTSWPWMRRGMRATMPRSMMPSRPSGVISRLPGCGSACSSPSPSSVFTVKRKRVSDSSGPSMSSSPSGPTSVTFLPGTYSMVSTWSVLKSGSGSGTSSASSPAASSRKRTRLASSLR